MTEEAVIQENQIESKPKEVEALRSCISELEQNLAERDTELVTIKKAAGELQEKLSRKENELSVAVADYRVLVLQTNPGIAEEFVTGDSVPAINESLTKARNLISKVRQSVEKEIARARVPFGSPGRQTQDLSELSPREKINYGIGGKK